MLALVSMRSASAIGSCVLVKKVISCWTPSSKTSKSDSSRSVTKRPSRSVTVMLRDTTSTPARNDGGWAGASGGWAGASGGWAPAAPIQASHPAAPIDAASNPRRTARCVIVPSRVRPPAVVRFTAAPHPGVMAARLRA